jgi:SP family sugar:H+ symporter-like MFS transporter
MVKSLGSLTVTFDQYNPNSEKGREHNAKASVSGLDYSPLPRITRMSIYMALLVSMGGLM